MAVNSKQPDSTWATSNSAETVCLDLFICVTCQEGLNHPLSQQFQDIVNGTETFHIERSMVFVICSVCRDIFHIHCYFGGGRVDFMDVVTAEAAATFTCDGCLQ